jgi:hypothetical protein
VMPVLVIAPWVFILLIEHQDRLPLETLYGRFLKTTGFATPMTTLAFSAAWILPLLAAIVAGDIFSSEDNHGTLKTGADTVDQPQCAVRRKGARRLPGRSSPLRRSG